jgi:hypothetical protein
VEIPEINVDTVAKEGLKGRQPIGDKSSLRKSAAGTKSGHNKKTKSNSVIKYVKGWERYKVRLTVLRSDQFNQL